MLHCMSSAQKNLPNTAVHRCLEAGCRSFGNVVAPQFHRSQSNPAKIPSLPSYRQSGATLKENIVHLVCVINLFFSTMEIRVHHTVSLRFLRFLDSVKTANFEDDKKY